MKRYLAGQAKSKDCIELWKQIEAGESYLILIGNEIIRFTYAVVVHVIAPDGKKQLYEIEKRGANGQIISRPNRPLGEKIHKVDIHPIMAAIRGMREELAIEVAEKDFIFLFKSVEIGGKSALFEGLSIRYLFHYQTKLNAKNYKDHYVEIQSKKTCIFGWVPL